MSIYVTCALVLAAILSLFFRSRLSEKIKAFFLFVVISIQGFSEYLDRVESVREVTIVLCVLSIVTIVLVVNRLRQAQRVDHE